VHRSITLVYLQLDAQNSYLFTYNKNVKQSHYRPGQALRIPESEAPTFQDNRHMKVARLSALRTGRLYPRNYSCYSFLLEAESTPGP